jgi:hypothetical protein
MYTYCEQSESRWTKSAFHQIFSARGPPIIECGRQVFMKWLRWKHEQLLCAVALYVFISV